MEKYLAVLGAEAIAASTPYVLVDLSDIVNFPHVHTKRIILHDLRLSAEKASDGLYDIWVGVITEVDGTNGTADWLHVFHLEDIANFTDDTDRFAQTVPFGGLDLWIDAGAALAYVVTNQQQAGHVNWQDDSGLASPVGAASGATGKPGVGDLVVWVEEVSGTGTIDFTISALYSTR